MKVRIKYRVHGAAEAVLQPGQVVELDEDKAHDLIKRGVGECLDGDSLSTGAEASADALRDEKAALEKQVAALKKALKKGKGKTSLGPAGGAPAPDSPQAGRQDRAPADMHTPEGG